MTDTLTGSIDVTAENPVATVDVSVTVNAALRAAPTNATEVSIGATNTVGLHAAEAKTLVTIEALDGPAGIKHHRVPVAAVVPPGLRIGRLHASVSNHRGPHRP